MKGQWFACSEDDVKNLKKFITIEFSNFSLKNHYFSFKRLNFRFLFGSGVSWQRFLGVPASWTSLWNICCSVGTQTSLGPHGLSQCACPDFLSEKSLSGTACIGRDARQCESSSAQKTCSLRK